MGKAKTRQRQQEEEEKSSSSDEEETQMEVEDDLDDVDLDSDEELQEAFAAGLIKPGLNTMFVAKRKREHVNDVQGLEQKLGEFRQKLPWIERLDLVCKPAPLAPELAYKEDQHQVTFLATFQNIQKFKTIFPTRLRCSHSKLMFECKINLRSVK